METLSRSVKMHFYRCQIGRTQSRDDDDLDGDLDDDLDDDYSDNGFN